MIYIWNVWWQEQTQTHHTSSVEPIVPPSCPPHLAQVCQLTLVERGWGASWCLSPPMSLSDTSHHSLAIVDTRGSPPFQHPSGRHLLHKAGQRGWPFSLPSLLFQRTDIQQVEGDSLVQHKRTCFGCSFPHFSIFRFL